MPTRLWLISHASTAAQRSATFAGNDEPLDARGLAEVNAHAQRERIRFESVRNLHALTSPAACARDTARALGLTATVAAELADTCYGEWQRLRIADVATQAPLALEAWLRDPAAAPPGGESFEMVLSRVGIWLDKLALSTSVNPTDSTVRTVVAITHAAVLRAALIHVLRASATSFTQIEIAPLTTIELRHHARHSWKWWPGAPLEAAPTI
ncbi:histidine phosphatase family protein [Paraburkholderia rhizosphaerae]|uniref:Broad specificity phosphatase PhoE n=1 Tax=Paraburkholderia rhizosphaerae TaxID=480658 RepID=A0A4R8M228_9BURK|nr:histidine phosphatase family protein [Paraburkholderia rhizosphaerae]TDY54200.1 broad specificity phosphatase PhoE [Paraburkholderia rhizosphaerae]